MLSLNLLHEREDWLASHRATIAKSVEAGWEAADRGEPYEATEVQATMEERKRALMTQKPQK
jgi:hypothetical protein